MRLPLQIGTSGLAALERAAMFLVPSLVLGLIAAGPLVFVFSALGDDMPDFIGQYVFIALLIPVVPFIYAVTRGLRALGNAIAERPSDLIIDGNQLVLRGGPHHGLIANLQAARCTLRDVSDDDDSDHSELLIGDVVVAAAALPGERRSLAAVHRTLEAFATTSAPAPAPVRAPEVVTCPACGAPALPADAATVVCASCHAQVPVPAEVRDRCRALATLAETGPRNQRRLRSLLRQPSARTANTILIGIGLPMMLVWPAAGFAAWVLYRMDRLDVGPALALALGAMTLVGVLYFLTRIWLVDRQGLAVVTLHFGAEPPRAPGEPPTCRVCSGPLPVAGKTLFVRCAYCGSDNVLGLDVRGDASRETEQDESLATALAQRSRDRRVFGAAAVLALAALAGEVVLMRPVVAPVGTWLRCHGRGPECGTPLEDLDARCASGDATACAGVVTSARQIDPSFDLGPTEALAALEAGCARGAGAACAAAGDHYQSGTHEPDRAHALLARGCDLHSGPACAELGEILEGRREPDADQPATPVRSAAAYALFARACDAGSPSGCLDEATYHRAGAAGVAIDPGRAGALAARACKLGAGRSPGCDQVACDGGDLDRCVDLTIAYQRNEGVRDDDERVEQLDTRACDGGNPRGCTEVGYRREHGYASPVDLDAAATLYQRGCDGGNGLGCFDLGTLFRDGSGRDVDEAKAAQLFERACKLGYSDGCDARDQLAHDAP